MVVVVVVVVVMAVEESNDDEDEDVEEVGTEAAFDVEEDEEEVEEAGEACAKEEYMGRRKDGAGKADDACAKKAGTHARRELESA